VLADPASTVLVDEVLPTLVGASTLADRPLIYGRIRALVQSAPPAAVAWAQRAMAARPDSFDTLRGCPVPALVVVGEQDRRAPPSDAQAMADTLPDATLVRIPDVGHLSAVEDPARFNRAVGDFLIRL
jgi:pimeloyl-ACP methyl ester carboxylesterase